MKTFPSSKHSGITLISLLIATALGIFIMAAAGQVYINSQAAYSLRSSVSAVGENGRYALDDIRRTLVMTGRGISAAQSAFAQIDPSGISDAGASSSASDIIAVRYAEGSSCAGNVSGFSTIRIKVVNNILICELNGANVPLVSGVHLMRVLYGVADNPLTNSSANRYLTAAAVDTAGAWRDVVAMRVGLVVSSDNETLPVHMRDSSVQTIDLLGMTFTPPDAERLFRAVTTTVVLRNLNPIISKQ
ncbi:MAG: PilW family protein [Xanthomonadales bacterium]|nr:PilW family protein [Xanthomonadales bacterium]